MYRFLIAARYLVTRKIAYISIIAITFGVMSMIVVMSVMDGFQEKIRKNIRSVDASLVIRRDANELFGAENFDAIAERMKPFMQENGGPVAAISKRLSAYALLSTTAVGEYSATRQPRNWAVQVLGIDPKLEAKVLPWADLLDGVRQVNRRVSADPVRRADPFTAYDNETGLKYAEAGIILGSWVAERLYVGVGDLVTVVTAAVPKDADPTEMNGVKSLVLRCRVTGCFESGRFDFDDHIAFIDGRELQKLLGAPSDCSAVHARLVDPEAAEAVRGELEAKIPGLRVQTWRDRMKALADALDVEKAVMMIISFFIVLVAGASICGILYMVVIEKTRDVGILMSMGATSGGITQIFLIYGGMLGVAGTLLGTIAGLEVAWNINAIKDFLDARLGIQLFPPNIYQFKEIPAKVDYLQTLKLAAGTLGACFVAAAVPALRASRLDPVKCLSYE